LFFRDAFWQKNPIAVRAGSKWCGASIQFGDQAQKGCPRPFRRTKNKVCSAQYSVFSPPGAGTFSSLSM
jgi:hypothetical protein